MIINIKLKENMREKSEGKVKVKGERRVNHSYLISLGMS